MTSSDNVKRAKICKSEKMRCDERLITCETNVNTMSEYIRVDLECEAEKLNSKGKDKDKDQDANESREFRTLHYSQIDEEGNESESNNMATLQGMQCYISPIPWESTDNAIDSSSRDPKNPASYLSHDTPTLANLYQTSRRSRQSPHYASFKMFTVPSRMIPPPPLISLSYLDGNRVHHEVNAGIDTTSDESRLHNLCLPSREVFEELGTNGAVSDMEVFDEDDIVEGEPNRLKTVSEEEYFPTVPSKMIPSPPLISSPCLDGNRVYHEVNDDIDTASDEYHLRNQCLSSRARVFEELGTNETVSAREVFDEDDIVEGEPKRLKTVPEDEYFFNIVSYD